MGPHPDHQLQLVSLRIGLQKFADALFIRRTCGKREDGRRRSVLAGRELIAIEFEKEHAHHEPVRSLPSHERMILHDTGRVPGGKLNDVLTSRGNVIERPCDTVHLRGDIWMRERRPRGEHEYLGNTKIFGAPTPVSSICTPNVARDDGDDESEACDGRIASRPPIDHEWAIARNGCSPSGSGS